MYIKQWQIWHIRFGLGWLMNKEPENLYEVQLQQCESWEILPTFFVFFKT